jgi:hypothetical protein
VRLPDLPASQRIALMERVIERYADALPTVPCSRSAQIVSVSQDQNRQSIEARCRAPCRSRVPYHDAASAARMDQRGLRQPPLTPDIAALHPGYLLHYFVQKYAAGRRADRPHPAATDR